MSELLERRNLRGVWRRRLFRLWIGASLLVAGYLAIAGPLSMMDGRAEWYVAAVPLALMAIMAVSGVLWLALFVMSRREKETKTTSQP